MSEYIYPCVPQRPVEHVNDNAQNDLVLADYTYNGLLQALKNETLASTKDLIMPTRIQKKDEEQAYRAPDVFLMRLPDSNSATKKAPYALHQFLNAQDIQEERMPDQCKAIVRTILCVYNPDEQEGALMLLNFASRIRIHLLKSCVIGEKHEFELDKEAGLHFVCYPDDTAPYYAGEMISTWTMPPIQREVPEVWGENLKSPMPW